MADRPKTILFIAIFLIIACSCAFFYSNSLHNPFIWDDDALIVKNPIIRSWSNLPKAFTSDLYSGVSFGSNFYRPIQTISYMWDYSWWQLDPYGYHLTNLFLQILVSFLVFLFTRSFFNEIRISIAAALLFALNPLHTEVVTYISGRAEMLIAVFLLLSLLLFMRGNRFFSWLAFIFALLSKELAVAFPLIIIAYLFCCRGEAEKKEDGFLRPAIPFLAIDFLYLLLRLTSLSFLRSHPPALTKYPLLARFMVLPDILLTYFKLLVLPVDLHMSWTLKHAAGFIGIFFNWFLSGLVLICGYYILKRNKNPGVWCFMSSWFFIFLLPQAGLLPINTFIAEHFLYLSSISFFILLGFLLNKSLRKQLFYPAVILLGAFYGILTFSRNFDWQDPAVFYKKIIKFSPNSFQAHNNLGLEYERRHLFDLALIEYKKALEIEPGLMEARSNLANLYFQTGKFKDALLEYSKVEKNAPKNKAGELQNNIGCVFEVEGLPDDALRSYRLALRLDPALNFTHFNIARIYAAKGNFDLAAQEALQSLPEINSPIKKSEEYRAIVSSYVKLPNVFQSGAVFFNDLGVKFASRGLWEGSITAFNRAIELDPFYADAHFNLGLVFWKNGLKNKAIFEFKSILKNHPNYLKAKEFLSEIIYKKY
ncbi:MAG: tetratricopeptide repeat protein [Candidatus Omnitrophota bacterium]